MKLYILRLGSLKIDRNRIVQYSIYASAANPSALNESVNIPVWAALIKHAEGNVLFDLGCLPNAMEGGWSQYDRDAIPWTFAEDETMERQLSQAGVAPQDVGTVIASHLHPDHFGNIGLFPHADIYVPREDWVEAMMTVHGTSDVSKHGCYYDACINAPVKQYYPIAINEDFELFPGLEIITLPGHTLNLLGMVVHLQYEGTLIFPSDALYTPENFGPPPRPGGCSDSLSYIRSVEKIRKLQKKYQAQIMYSHDMPLYKTFKKAPHFYH